MTLGEKISQLRKERHLSQEELAEAMQMSRQAISKWENGSARPNRKKLTRLADFFEVDVNVLLSDQPQGQPEEGGPGRDVPAATSNIRRIKWIVAVLALTTALFAGLWVYEIQNGQGVKPDPAQMNQDEDERWQQFKMHRYAGPVWQEIVLSDGEKRELAYRMRHTSFKSTNTTDPGNQEIIYGGLRIKVVELISDTEKLEWIFEDDRIHSIVTLADSTQLKQEFQEDHNLFRWLKTFLW